MHIAIITGGQSTERDISLNSAANVSSLLTNFGYKVDVFDFPSKKDEFLQNYNKYNLIFPCIHGVGGEDGQVTALATLLGKKYIFANTMGHSLCLHKYASTMLAKKAGLTVPETVHITDMECFSRWDCERDRFIVKPNSGGSSVDTAIFIHKDNARDLVQKILDYDTVIIQKVIKGKELTVSMFATEKEKPSVLAITEIQHTNEFFDLQAKYDPKTLELTPAPIDDALEKSLERSSIKAFNAFACKDFVRVDYIRDGENIYFIEINTIPGMTETSIVPRACQYSDFSDFGNFLDMIIQSKV